jgi:glutamate dehydrogenase (NADP+)
MKTLHDALNSIKEKYPDQTQFLQAAQDVFHDIFPYIEGKKDYARAAIIERLLEPDRIIQFRVTWQNQKGDIEVNRGWRVQYNNAIGAYKGGLRFHPSVNTDTFKFLAFEQTFKNALTGLAMGGGKGGSDFNPKGRSEADIMSFCQAFMLELYKYIGPDIDVPAGDIGVSAREIGYMQGMYKKLTDHFDGTLTGKAPSFGGSLIRKEATGYGAIYFLDEALKHKDENLEGRTCVISGAGNVALYAAQKLLQHGAKVLTLSDSKGMVHMPKGLSRSGIELAIQIKETQRSTLEDFSKRYKDCTYHAGKEPWDVACDIAVPCATQNEIDVKEAKVLAQNGVKWICEGANMPLTIAATKHLRKARAVVLPSKAVNAGGVSTSGFERTQNAMYMSWAADHVDETLHGTMKNIHKLCVEYGHCNDGWAVDYIKGANIAGFDKVAKAMMAYGTL